MERSGNKARHHGRQYRPTLRRRNCRSSSTASIRRTKSRSTDRDGVGLGLYIVKTIVLAHGEDIYVTSRDGKTEFTFTLPLVL